MTWVGILDLGQSSTLDIPGTFSDATAKFVLVLVVYPAAGSMWDWRVPWRNS